MVTTSKWYFYYYYCYYFILEINKPSKLVLDGSLEQAIRLNTQPWSAYYKSHLICVDGGIGRRSGLSYIKLEHLGWKLPCESRQIR